MSVRSTVVALVVACAFVPSLARDCEVDSNCTACTGNSASRCTGCEAGFVLNDFDGNGEGSCEQRQACEWKDDFAEDYFGKILIASIGGSVVTLATTIVVSLPVCCGIMKDFGGLKFMATISCVIGCFSLLVPFAISVLFSVQVLGDVCDGCQAGCTDDEKRDILRSAISALGVYAVMAGFLVTTLGCATMCLSCCVCRPCFGPLYADKVALDAAEGARRVESTGEGKSKGWFSMRILSQV